MDRAGANDAEQERRRARRDFVRRHHPDRGGDAERFRRGLADFDAPAYPSVEQARPPLAETLARAVGRWAADLRRVPGQVRDAYREGRAGEAP